LRRGNKERGIVDEPEGRVRTTVARSGSSFQARSPHRHQREFSAHEKTVCDDKKQYRKQFCEDRNYGRGVLYAVSQNG
jgi:hypothetical protein